MKKNKGKRFEENFKNSIPGDVFCYRLRDAGGWAKSEETRFTISNICDFIVYDFPYCLLVELKSVSGKSLPFSNINTSHLRKMVAHASDTPVKSVYLVQFRQVEMVYYINANLIEDFMINKDLNKGRKSIPIDFFKNRGHLIEAELKRTNYKFDLNQLFGRMR